MPTNDQLRKKIDLLLYRMSDSAVRRTHALADAYNYGVSTITGSRRYKTYENQIDRYDKAEAELRSLLDKLLDH